MDAEVVEWGEVVLVDGIPQTKLGGEAPVEVSEDVEPVGPLRLLQPAGEKCLVEPCAGAVIQGMESGALARAIGPSVRPHVRR